MESPLIRNGGGAGSSALGATDLHHAPPEILLADGEGGDYPRIQNFEDVKNICYLESVKLWAIAGPIAFNILCNYGINSFTNIFVGHIGNVELSAVAISLSVLANFSFGFLVSFLSSLSLYLLLLGVWSNYLYIFPMRDLIFTHVPTIIS